MKFQTLDWCYEDSNNELFINIYGCTEDGTKSYIKVTNFKPYYYVRIPQEWSSTHIDNMINTVTTKINKFHQIQGTSHVAWYEPCDKYVFRYFNGNKSIRCVKLYFNTSKYRNMLVRSFMSYIEHHCGMGGQYSSSSINDDYTIFNSKIDPLIMFIHELNLKSVGIIEIPDDKLKKILGNVTCTDCSYETSYRNIKQCDEITVYPITIMSYDIECMGDDDGSFPQAIKQSNVITQIACTFNKFGSSNCYKKVMLTLNSCDDIDDIEVHSFDKERDLLLMFKTIVQRENPDIITGWNIFGFDNKYVHDRGVQIGCERSLSMMSKKSTRETCEFSSRSMGSKQMNMSEINMYTIPGRIQIDMMHVVQKEHKLTSYKLDNVALTFIRGQITNIDGCKLYTDNTQTLVIGQFIAIVINENFTEEKIPYKFKIIDLHNDFIEVDDEYGLSEVRQSLIDDKKTLYWTQAKDDVSPTMIREYQKKDTAHRTLIAKYCIQDSVLCNLLIERLRIISSAIGMANVCSVPLSYLFLRGQGIKGLSYISKVCAQKNYILPSLHLDKQQDGQPEEESYAGAMVFEPVPGVYMDPIAVLDYASLYPMSIIATNISHETIVKDNKYMNMQGYEYNVISVSDLSGNERKVTFAKDISGKKGIIPEILEDLIVQRRKVKKLMNNETDSHIKEVYDGLQLAYKITANSIYGLCGASVGQIGLKDLAAATTAVGRNMLKLAKTFIEDEFIDELNENIDNNTIDAEFTDVINLVKGCNCNDKTNVFEIEFDDTAFQTDNIENNTLGDIDITERVDLSNITKKREVCTLCVNTNVDVGKCKHQLYECTCIKDKINIKPIIIYGDTDSIFINFNTKLTDEQKSIYVSIELGRYAAKLVKSRLIKPHDLEYEKTYYPFIILKKKKYVGNKYEFDSTKYERNVMGIVIKRRDIAPVVKSICNDIINIILDDRDLTKLEVYIRNTIANLLNGKFNISSFMLSKTLKENYKDRSRIAHVVLADRIKQRDPGNAPLLNERIPYVYIVNPDYKPGDLQGDRIETPTFIKMSNLQIDYIFYITNHIKKPACQFLGTSMDMKPDVLFDEILKEELDRVKYNFILDRVLHDKTKYVCNSKDYVNTLSHILHKRTSIKIMGIHDVKK